MNNQDFETLHEAHEPFEAGFKGGHIYNMIEIMGGGQNRVVCVSCGRWQRFCALNSEMAKADMERRGWKINIGGDDRCPKCKRYWEGTPVERSASAVANGN